jgi:uncharacterized membrane protein YvbJ
MSCLKCGKKTAEDQSFCAACLEAMDAYPVKSDVHLQLPNRINSTAAKKASRKRRVQSAEEQAASLRRSVRYLTVLSVLLLALLVVCAGLLVQSWIAAGDLKIPMFDCFT